MEADFELCLITDSTVLVVVVGGAVYQSRREMGGRERACVGTLMDSDTLALL